MLTAVSGMRMSWVENHLTRDRGLRSGIGNALFLLGTRAALEVARKLLSVFVGGLFSQAGRNPVGREVSGRPDAACIQKRRRFFTKPTGFDTSKKIEASLPGTSAR
jgi:hypothetical protein